MTRQCRYVLKEIRKLSDNTSCWLGANSSQVYKVDSPKSEVCDFNKYKRELDTILNELLRTEYIKTNKSGASFCLTHKGLHPYEFEWEKIKSFLFSSIFIPIVVALITSTLINFLF